MTDYTTMTDAELESTKESLQASQIQNTAERDVLNQKGVEIQGELDQISTIQEARKEVAEMSDEERQAMQQALNG